MALFTDGIISTVEDLRSYERAILDVASSERLDLSRKLVLAQQELELELTDFLLQEAEQDPGSAGARQPNLGKVVVTSALRQWHTLHTLMLAYRDAYSSHLNDRYRAKQKEFERLSKWASEKYFDTGAGMVVQPVPRAAPPVLTSEPGLFEGATYWARVSWAGVTGEEGSPSDPAVLTAGTGNRLAVAAQSAPPDTQSWNVYAGLSAEEISRQNDEPLALGSVWTLPDAGIRTGAPPGEGQSPEYFVRRRRVLQRG